MRLAHLNGFGLAALLAVLVGPLMAAETPSTTKDLTSVLALLGLPCGEVTAAQRRADNDYVATCKDGNRYRVYTNAQGRVVADKQ